MDRRIRRGSERTSPWTTSIEYGATRDVTVRRVHTHDSPTGLPHPERSHPRPHLTTPIANRFYSFTDRFTNVAFDLDGSTMANYSVRTSCTDILASDRDGWYMDLAAGRGEQTVTSAVIFGGIVFFSTNRPTASMAGSCGSNLGEARGYAMNMMNASGVIGSGKLCGGERSDVFTGGGLPPSPVVGVVPVKQANGTSKATHILIGGINVEGGVSSSAIAAQEPKVPLRQIRSRVYWYSHSDR